MGNTSSTISPEQEYKKELEERGVLIPPNFGILSGEVPRPTFSPSLLDRLLHESLSYAILHQHLTPGLWLTSETNPEGSVLAQLMPSGQKEYQGLLGISQQLSKSLSFNFVHHSHQSSPTLFTRLELTPFLTLNSHFSVTEGTGWLATHYQATVPNVFAVNTSEKEGTYYRNNPFSESQSTSNRTMDLQLGSWIDLQQPLPRDTAAWSSHVVSQATPSAYAALQVPGCTLAVEAVLRQEPQFSYHAFCNLTHAGPPLYVTLRSTPTSSSMSLSQVVSWDRWVLNLLETRCPKIRNSIAWTLEMNKEQKTTATPRAGVAWQLNRNVAFKAAAQPDEWTATVLFKRWRQPRVLCSVLIGNQTSNNAIVFKGVSVGIEIGRDSDDYDESINATLVSPHVPETKTTLPD